jgi:hypothetical protein
VYDNPYASSTERRYASGHGKFDFNVGRASQEGKPKRFLYKDANGRETPIYLRLDQVAHNIDPAGTSDQG